MCAEFDKVGKFLFLGLGGKVLKFLVEGLYKVVAKFMTDGHHYRGVVLFLEVLVKAGVDVDSDIEVVEVIAYPRESSLPFRFLIGLVLVLNAKVVLGQVEGVLEVVREISNISFEQRGH